MTAKQIPNVLTTFAAILVAIFFCYGCLTSCFETCALYCSLYCSHYTVQ